MGDDAPQVPKSVKKERWSPEAMVKGRNEPCTIGRVAHVVARGKDLSTEEVAKAGVHYVQYKGSKANLGQGMDELGADGWL